MIKGLKLRIYPNKEQEAYIASLLGSYRFVFNKCLDLKIKSYTNEKKNIGLKELGNYFHQDLSKDNNFNWLSVHNTKVLKQSIIDLLDSYKRFFVNGNGFPSFKRKNQNSQSCRFPKEAMSSKNNYLSGKLTLTKQLKDIKFKCSDNYKNLLNDYQDQIKSATLSKTKSNTYYLSILIDVPIESRKEPNNKFIGLDIGIKDFIVTSSGEVFKNIKVKRNNEKKLIKLNRNLSKKVNGSKNRGKARVKLAKFHERLNNIKNNYLHHISNSIVNENQVIIMEDLNVRGMLKNHKLSKSIQELSINSLKSMIEYKSRWYNRDFVLIDRYFPSSKRCSACKSDNKSLSLKDRDWTCKSCNTHHDRDFNASINIMNEGKRLYEQFVGSRTPEITLVDYPLMDDKESLRTPLKSNGRLKQENHNV